MTERDKDSLKADLARLEAQIQALQGRLEAAQARTEEARNKLCDLEQHPAVRDIYQILSEAYAQSGKTRG